MQSRVFCAAGDLTVAAMRHPWSIAFVCPCV